MLLAEVSTLRDQVFIESNANCGMFFLSGMLFGNLYKLKAFVCSCFNCLVRTLSSIMIQILVCNPRLVILIALTSCVFNYLGI